MSEPHPHPAPPRCRIREIAGHAARSLLGSIAIIGGAVTWYFADELMLRRIYLIGEDHALGRENVIRLADGGTLLTNPGAMLQYELPFLAGAVVLVVLGSWLWYRECRAILRAMRSRREQC